MKVSTLVTRMRKLGLKPHGYLDGKIIKVAYFTAEQFDQIEQDFIKNPNQGRGWPKGKTQKRGAK